MRRKAKLIVLAACLQIPSPVLAAFGLTNSGGYYIVDTGAGLVFKVKQSSGDITSLKYFGVEYQEPTKGSHINSGLGTSNVSATVYGGDYVKITVVDNGQTLTHYYIARNGFNHIYMATYFTEEPAIGLVRFIVRIPSRLLPDGPLPSNIRGNSGQSKRRISSECQTARHDRSTIPISVSSIGHTRARLAPTLVCS